MGRLSGVNKTRALLIALAWAIASILLIIGVLYYRNTLLQIEADRGSELKAIAELKVSQIVAWRRERIGDAMVHSTGVTRDQILRWLKTPGDAKLAASLTRGWNELGRVYGYHTVLLLTPDGRQLLRADPERIVEPAEPEALRLVRQAASTRNIAFGDLFRCPIRNSTHLDEAAPVLDEAGRVAAVVLLRMDPDDLLYPLIQTWPIPSGSSETLLVRRDGDSVLFLNRLRYDNAPALTRRIPLSQGPVPAVSAVLGTTGIFHGMDYRNVDVMAALLPVPQSGWFMVAKIDSSEMLREARERGALVALLIIFGIITTMLASIVIWKRYETGLYRNLYLTERYLSRARAIVSATLDGVFVVDPETSRISDVNEAAIECTGYSRAELLALSFRDLDPDLSEAKWRAIVEHARTHGNHLLQLKCKHKNGGALPVEAAIRYIRQEDAEYVVVSARDITDRLRAEQLHRNLQEQFHQAQKMESIGRLTGGIAHDFNNLLTVINGYAFMALRRLPAGDPMHRPLEQISTAGERAGRLVRQLLAFSRKQVLEPEVLNLNRLLGDMQGLLQRIVSEDIELVFRFAPSLANVIVDPNQFEQVIMNLVVNGRDAMPDGGTLTISTENSVNAQGSGLVRVTVRDTGTGIPEEAREHLFEPFFTTKEQGKGTGLGLATVQGIVLQSGGLITFETELGKGTAFVVSLPAVQSGEERGSSTSQPVVTGGTETILLVEDQDAVRTFLATALETYGYQVLAASGGEQAMRIADTAKIDLLVTDIVMPKMNGAELANLLAVRQPWIRTILISGYSEDIHRQDGRRQAGHHQDGTERHTAAFLQKPFSPETLARKIREVLESARAL